LTTLLVCGILLVVVLVGKLIFGGEMYRNVLLTDKEIALLKTIINQTLHEKMSIDRNNLTIIHNRLLQIKPLVSHNQFFNYGK
jgi:hypothetical protein